MEFRKDNRSGVGSIILLIAILLYSCISNEPSVQQEEIIGPFDKLAKSEIMILGIFHFGQQDQFDIQSKSGQAAIQELLDKLKEFKPTKVVIEKEAKHASHFNKLYQKYKAGTFSIDTLYNEVYQVGFRLANQLSHDSIWLFDDHPPFIGSLEGFTFDSLQAYAQAKDSGYFDLYEDRIMETWDSISTVRDTLELVDYVRFLNSPEMQRYNIHRMHMYEYRIGTGDNFIGSDWLGRYYQRNLRMLANIMKFNNIGEDRILVVVGSNHKWILDQLISNTPEFELAQPSNYF